MTITWSKLEVEHRRMSLSVDTRCWPNELILMKTEILKHGRLRHIFSVAILRWAGFKIQDSSTLFSTK